MQAKSIANSLLEPRVAGADLTLLLLRRRPRTGTALRSTRLPERSTRLPKHEAAETA